MPAKAINGRCRGPGSSPRLPELPRRWVLGGFPNDRGHPKVDVKLLNSLKESGAPEEIRTPSLLIRSQMLYPVELRALTIFSTASCEALNRAVRRGPETSQ